MVGARADARRTPVGAELLRRVNGFRAYLQTAGVDRAGPAQPADRFSPYLPYAIVFGLTEQWTRTVALVGAPPQTPWFWGREPYHRPVRRPHGALLVVLRGKPDAPPPPASATRLRADAAWVGGSWGGGGSSGGGGSGGGGGGSRGGGGSSGWRWAPRVAAARVAAAVAAAGSSW